MTALTVMKNFVPKMILGRRSKLAATRFTRAKVPNATMVVGCTGGDWWTQLTTTRCMGGCWWTQGAIICCTGGNSWRQGTGTGHAGGHLWMRVTMMGCAAAIGC
eukprot:CAMPEP_0174294448 /NCGR_PEP_ID=MMETSP0809-20121228/41671_1 /TAXON_ID=73025 ORGANISM="Eutreptiella gymnastica-like, Strain CCMP1594" /NCGR_SAMPLE_ID=MMETSP0809 /ASSEMBLY_ACC=CAM_ASM_000658 /LENGTH=103 /DNA_ID=CAMNT_0015395903 /DNA_START=930 /DNA_END=1241 /DNA_ORIENTATION=+